MPGISGNELSGGGPELTDEEDIETLSSLVYAGIGGG
jgi:hypothetical protein